MNRAELDRWRLQPWRSFLEPLVGREKPVPVARLDDELRKLTGREGDARGEIYAYLRAKQAVRANRAFWIGEALRECGIGWSSGPLALAAAGRYEEFVALLALLSAQGDSGERRATIFAAACAVLTCDNPQDRELVAVQRDTRERLANLSRASTDLVRDAWMTLAKKQRGYGRLFQTARPALRDAFISASLADGESRARRVFEDLSRWAIAFARRNARLLGIVQRLFARRAHFDELRARGYYRDALIDAQRIYGAIGFRELLRDDESDFGSTTTRRINKRNVKKGRNP